MPDLNETELGYRESEVTEADDIHDFDEMRGLGSRSRPSARTAGVMASISSGSLLRDTAASARAIVDLYGDEEAHLAGRAEDLVANLTMIQLVIRNHPGRFLASVLGDLDPSERAKAIAEARAALDEMEAQAKSAPETDTAAEPVVSVMATGSRKVGDPDATRTTFEFIISKLREDHPGLIVIAGGATGVDQLWAEAAASLGCPFTLFLPNWAYEYNYGQHEALEALRASPSFIGERFAVERPKVEDWQSLWRSQRWWQDNFTRNDKMIKPATYHVCGSWHPPREILADTSIGGGTAHAVRRMKALKIAKTIHVDLADARTDNIHWVNI